MAFEHQDNMIDDNTFHTLQGIAGYLWGDPTVTQKDGDDGTTLGWVWVFNNPYSEGVDTLTIDRFGVVSTLQELDGYQEFRRFCADMPNVPWANLGDRANFGMADEQDAHDASVEMHVAAWGQLKELSELKKRDTGNLNFYRTKIARAIAFKAAAH